MEDEILQRLDQLKELQLLATKTWLTLEDVSELTGYAKSYIRKLCNQNVLGYSRPTGKEIFIKKEELNKFFEKGYIPSVKQIINDTVR